VFLQTLVFLQLCISWVVFWAPLHWLLISWPLTYFAGSHRLVSWHHLWASFMASFPASEPCDLAATAFRESHHLWSTNLQKASLISTMDPLGPLLSPLLLISSGHVAHDAYEGLLNNQLPEQVLSSGLCHF
jgi:hypothetical protein